MTVDKKESTRRFGNKVNIVFTALIIIGLILIIIKNKERLDEYKETLVNINYWQVLVVFGIAVSTNVFRSWRWYYLLVPIKFNLSFITVLRVNINGIAANLSTPGKAGIPVKAYLLKKIENIDYSRSLPSLLGELVFEYSGQILFMIGSILVGGHFSKLYLTTKTLVQNQSLLNNTLLVIAGGSVLIFTAYLLRKKINLSDFTNKFKGAVQETGKRWDCWLYSGSITLFNLIIEFAGFWLLLVSLGHSEIGFTFIIFSSAITNVVGLLSPLPGGIGAREITIYGLYDFYLGLGGIAFLAMLIMRIITYLALFMLFLLERAISSMLHAKKLNEYPVG